MSLRLDNNSSNTNNSNSGTNGIVHYTCLIPPHPDAVPVERVYKAIAIAMARTEVAVPLVVPFVPLVPVEVTPHITFHSHSTSIDTDAHIDTRVSTATATATSGIISIPLDCITCQVRLSVRDEVPLVSQKPVSLVWTVQSLNTHGLPTMMAARHSSSVSTATPHHAPHDEFYLVYHTHQHALKGNRPLAIAIMEPITTNWIHHSGSNDAPSHVCPEYRVEWVSSPMNWDAATTTATATPTLSTPLHPKPGHVSIHFCYTAGLANIPPPLKRLWQHGASTQTCYIQTHIPIPPNCRVFQPPSPPLRLSQRHDLILAFGDSILEQLVASSTSSSSSSSSSSCRIVFGPKVAMPLLTHTVSFFLDALNAFINEQLLESESPTTRRVGLILNSALWDILSDEATLPSDAQVQTNGSDTVDSWSNHLTAVRDYLNNVLAQYSTNTFTLYWLLPTAVHIHRVHLNDSTAMRLKAPQKINRTRYLSASRTRDLYMRQQDVVVSLLSSQTVPWQPESPLLDVVPGLESADTNNDVCFWLDLYEATYLSADWTLSGDGRHYRPELNHRMLSWFL